MNRPTISDLAAEAGVSVSTVNRILAGSGSVRAGTIQRVRDAAERIGFYGMGVIEARGREALPRFRLGFLLQQSGRELYRMFGAHIDEAVSRREDAVIEPTVDYVDDLRPETIAAALTRLGAEVDAVALIAEDHPLIAQSIDGLKARGVPVVAYITDQSATSRAAYVGADNWKAGRTAAWFIAETTHGPGTVAVFIGNHRYQCQDIADAGFRSYLRENAPRLKMRDSEPTHESPEQARAMVERLLAEEKDLVGLFVTGGGISGVLKALRAADPERRKAIRVVGRDLGPETRSGLTEGLITAALCHPLDRISDELVDAMLTAARQKAEAPVTQRIVPMDIVVPASV